MGPITQRKLSRVPVIEVNSPRPQLGRKLKSVAGLLLPGLPGGSPQNHGSARPAHRLCVHSGWVLPTRGERIHLSGAGFQEANSQDYYKQYQPAHLLLIRETTHREDDAWVYRTFIDSSSRQTAALESGWLMCFGAAWLGLHLHSRGGLLIG